MKWLALLLVLSGCSTITDDCVPEPLHPSIAASSGGVLAGVFAGIFGSVIDIVKKDHQQQELQECLKKKATN